MSTSPAPLARTSPESQGISSRAIQAFLDDAALNQVEMHSLMLLRRGQVVAEGWWQPYAPSLPHQLYSLSKSFTSTAVGLAIAEGRLSLNDPLLSFFPAEAPRRPSRNLAAMRVRHLLSMSTGHADDTTGFMRQRRDGNWEKAFLQRPVKFAPGTHFLYNTGASYMLSAIVQKLTGQRLLDYLTPRLFAPLGITNPTWEQSPRGVDVGGWGLSLTTEDIARFGQLYLQKGLWQGQQLLPAAWVEQATTKQIENGTDPASDWAMGYGYQFWRCRHGAYRADGAFGQYCIIFPAQQAVLAMTSGQGDMQLPLNLVWKHLLPALGASALPADPGAHTALQVQLSRLALPPLSGAHTSPLAHSLAGKRFSLQPNPQKFSACRFEFGPDWVRFTATTADGSQHAVTCGLGAWVPGITMLINNGQPLNTVASAAWQSADTLDLRLRFIETPFFVQATCVFHGAALDMRWKLNVNFGPLELPSLTGKMEL